MPSNVKPQGSAATDYGDGYGSDLMGDEDDRAALMAMNELDREMILAERSEARDREREKRKTAQLLKQRQREVDQVTESSNSQLYTPLVRHQRIFWDSRLNCVT